MGRSDQVDVTRRHRIAVVAAMVAASAAGVLVLIVLVGAWRGAVEARQRNGRIHFFAVMACRPPDSPDRRRGESEEDRLRRMARRFAVPTATSMTLEMRDCVAKTEQAMRFR